MRFRFLLLIVLFSAGRSYASDSLQINLSKKTFVKGDTIEFTCVIPAFKELKLMSATLNVWIDDIETHKRWKYRYPVINGEVSASLAISDKIPDGKYAVNFLVQRGFFRISGTIRDHDKKDSLVNYFMIQTNKKSSYFDNTHVAPDGSFRLKSTLFADSAFFVFSPVKKTKNNYFFIKIETPLDSAFEPVLHETSFITVGDEKMLGAKKTDTSKYAFTVDDLSDPSMLPGVVVTTKFKKKVDQYNAEYSKGLFDKPDAIVFDGLENDEIARSADIYTYLQGRVAGLMIGRAEDGEQFFKWRDERAEIYIDEFKLDPDQHLFITPSEVAMIKVYRPPSGLSGFSSVDNGGAGSGAIAIYTKRGNFIDNTGRTRHNFIVRGYTQMDSSWR